MNAAALAPPPEGACFPTYVGHRRRLRPDDELFAMGNLARDEAWHTASLRTAHDELVQLQKEEALVHSPGLASYLSHQHECATCHASLPTAHLLEVHVAEMHDSFWAAQAARRMPVYACLVEGCHRHFCTVEERKQHLIDHHRFPRNYDFDRIHLRRRKAQVRPLPQYQKSTRVRASSGAPMDAASEAYHSGDAPAVAAHAMQPPGEGPSGEGTQAPEPVCTPPREGAAATTSGADVDMALDADLVQGISRLSMAAQQSEVPPVLSFGRRRGRQGMVRGRGRGRGGAAPSGGNASNAGT